MSKELETGLYRLNIAMRRSSNLTGVFIAPKAHVKYLIESGIEVYFGEVSGKHSEVYGPIEEKELTLITDDENVIKTVFDYKLESGLNPFDYGLINFEERDRFEDLTVGEIIEHKINGTYPETDEQ